MNAASRQPEGKTGKSPIIPARKVPEKLQRMLWGLSAGRCEFAGCNKDLFQHSTTLLQGNFAAVAHIVAFREDGPRGQTGTRPAQIHDLDNLMLLCPECHKLIDDRPEEFTHKVLAAYKFDHEKRVRHTTSFGPELKTTVVQLKALIAGHAVDIPISEVYDAVAPRWPVDRKGWVIDLTGIDVESHAGTIAAMQKIDFELHQLYAQGIDDTGIRHISLFALAPIHILAYLGSRMSNKIATDFFQRHRGSNVSPWQWQNSSSCRKYSVNTLQQGTITNNVAVVLSLSGSIQASSLPDEVDETFWIYEITFTGSTPSVDALVQREDHEGFRIAYREFLSQLTQDHGMLNEILVFPAIPAPIAVTIGYDLLPKVHPDLRIFDYDKSQGGFREKITLQRNIPH